MHREKIKYDFHVSLQARKKYLIPSEFFSIAGNVIMADFKAARILADKINSIRKNEELSEFVTPGLINAAALFHEILHFVIRNYDETENPGVIRRAAEHIEALLGDDSEALLKKFLSEFPPSVIAEKKIGIDDYLNGITQGKKNIEIVFEELLLLYIENINPAFKSIRELFDDSGLRQLPAYIDIINSSADFFGKEKPIGQGGLSLFKFLQMPILEHPDDIEAQLRYIFDIWGIALPEEIKIKILGGKDLIYEDSKLFVKHGGQGGTPEVPEYKLLTQDELNALMDMKRKGLRPVSIDEVSYSYYFEEEQFTEDIDWMPRVVMIAKNIFVWLDQLSKKYQRSIKHLNEIPDEELDRLKEWHFNALWLIGVWERCQASRKIKQFCGNHDATASAYSLYDYNIAEALGGFAAFENLKTRCWVRGIRLASDMVPNHTGIFSRWIMEHPDYYIQAEQPPYPGYSFTGPDLSDSPSFQIRVEDKYYTRNDAAVVFELIENSNGKVRYIYHGNDGTNMPWNDTAQLNLTIPDVRESLVQQIKHVASMFPIIRFDAAMTLTKKHFQRLWFPQPGTAGAIPSRADYSMSRDAFDAVIPNEFWREVVDRMNSEMADTLLLAEAFWLMEGYFVRTLGMHRVYNSAFMHMFMKEENYKYKELIKNTLEFNPEILKRYVNFMSNPDEETAINQFGKGDKYVGVCIMMLTLPGLPMFAHGQIEGFTEKYGMEYQRAYYNEFVDENLVKRHEHEIFPISLRRYLFCEVKNFWLYDFMISDNDVNHNVIAFTNGRKSEKALVLYNNSYEQTSGKLFSSLAKVKGDAQSQDNPEYETRTVSQALGLAPDANTYYICFELRSGQEYLISGRSVFENGFEFYLPGYGYKVFWNFREVIDQTGEYAVLYESLQGRGVVSIEQSLLELRTEKLHYRLGEIFSRNNINELRMISGMGETDLISDKDSALSNYLINRIGGVIEELKNLGYQCQEKNKTVEALRNDCNMLKFSKRFLLQESSGSKESAAFIGFLFGSNAAAYEDMLTVLTVTRRILSSVMLDENQNYNSLIQRLVLVKQLWQVLIRLNNHYEIIKEEFDLLIVLIAEIILPGKLYQIPKPEKAGGTPDKQKMKMFKNYSMGLFEIKELRDFVGYNVYEGVEYFSREKYDFVLRWNFLLTFFDYVQNHLEKSKANPFTKQTHDSLMKSRSLKTIYKELLSITQHFAILSQKTGYRLRDYLDAVLDASKTNAEASEKKKRVVKRTIKQNKESKKPKFEKRSNGSKTSRSIKPGH